jgi:hypothetical protein
MRAGVLAHILRPAYFGLQSLDATPSFFLKNKNHYGQGKGKEKKLARMQALARENLRKETVDRANFSEDGLSPRNVINDFAPFAQYSKAGLEASIEFTTGSTMPAETMTFVMDLARENMKQMYDDSGWDGGWKEKDKKAEASQEEAR